MPTYQYACKDCNYHFDEVQAFSDPTLTVCPRCSGHLRKVYGSVGVVFKGSGFYRTDSRAGSNKASLTAEHKSGSGPSKESTTSAKSDGASSAKKTPVAAGASASPAKSTS